MTPLDWIVFGLLFVVCVFGAPLLAYLKDKGVL